MHINTKNPLTTSIMAAVLALLLVGCSSGGETTPGADGGNSDTTIQPPGDGPVYPGSESSAGERPPETDSGTIDRDAPGPVGDTSGTVPGSWVTITAGTFMMGSPEAEACRESDETEHEVTLTRDFKMSTTEVTQGDFESLLGYNPSKETACGKDCPVESMTWHEAVAYCNALSKADGLAECYSCTGTGDTIECEAAASYADDIASCPGYRLPTEAEWEYAYRAGTRTMYYNGDPAVCSGTDATAEAIAWYNKNAGGTTNPVALKQANDWGLYDMAGNVQEIVHDDYQKELGADAATDPVVPNANPSSQGVIRGGSWAHGPDDLRAAHRKAQGRTSPGSAVGFRCVITSAP